MNHKFKNEALRREALTHPSTGGEDYQRLEFLGDRVLGLAVTELLYRKFPHAEEGELGRRLAALVREETLAGIARAWRLDREIVRDKSTPLTPAMLADAVEAMLGAVFMDAGWEVARVMVADHWHGLLETIDTKDAKTALQEWVQGRGEALPLYELIGTEGPEHSKLFSVRVTAAGHNAEGVGNSKKSAELAAAGALMEKLNG